MQVGPAAQPRPAIPGRPTPQVTSTRQDTPTPQVTSQITTRVTSQVTSQAPPQVAR